MDDSFVVEILDEEERELVLTERFINTTCFLKLSVRFCSAAECVTNGA